MYKTGDWMSCWVVGGNRGRRLKLLGVFQRQRAMNDGQYIEKESVIGQAFGGGQPPA
jgi:hypothetical protein